MRCYSEVRKLTGYKDGDGASGFKVEVNTEVAKSGFCSWARRGQVEMVARE